MTILFGLVESFDSTIPPSSYLPLFVRLIHSFTAQDTDEEKQKNGENTLNPISCFSSPLLLLLSCVSWIEAKIKAGQFEWSGWPWKRAIPQ